ncbi:restriction endonuclease subunit S [Brachyspira alvinipulli]|uniref:restriction endonuclease subunit S n=1 Tax=Brachyspira alvinipulli TaxID=84379 RepID=UPI0030072503
MSTLENLIKKYCPDGVEYKTLSELGSFYAGLNGKNKDDFKDGNAKYITYMNVFSNLSINLNINDTVQIDKKEKQNIVQYGDIIFTGSSETREECGMSSVLTKEPKEKLYLNSFCFGFRFNYKEIMLPDFSKYLFRSIELRKKIIQTSSGVTRFNVSKKKMETISIPLPPIEVQKEIVRILDEFTLKTIELQELLHKEYISRKKQYEYYQNKLLFNTKFNKIKMSDICTVNQGLQIPISQRKREEGKNRYFYITVQFLKGNNQDKYYIENPSENVICNTDDILVTRTGSTGKIITGVKGCFHNNFFKLNFFENVNKRYVYYVLNTKEMYEQMLNAASGGTVPDLPHKAFYKLEIYFPPLEEQERIVNILDRFDALCNDISSGLPAEIEMRKKQYEYYRDKLLTFKEKKV